MLIGKNGHQNHRAAVPLVNVNIKVTTLLNETVEFIFSKLDRNFLNVDALSVFQNKVWNTMLSKLVQKFLLNSFDLFTAQTMPKVVQVIPIRFSHSHISIIFIVNKICIVLKVHMEIHQNTHFKDLNLAKCRIGLRFIDKLVQSSSNKDLHIRGNPGIRIYSNLNSIHLNSSEVKYKRCRNRYKMTIS